MKISHPNKTEQSQTNGVLDRITTERRDDVEYFVTANPETKAPEAENMIIKENK